MEQTPEVTKKTYEPITFAVNGNSKILYISSDDFLKIPDVLCEFLKSHGVDCYTEEITTIVPTTLDLSEDVNHKELYPTIAEINAELDGEIKDKENK